MPGAPLPHDAPGSLWVSRSERRASAACSTTGVGSTPLALALRTEHGDLGLEVVGGLERAVDAGEPQVGHLVELAQRAEDGQADLVGGHLGPALAAQRVLDLLAQAGQVVLGDRPALAGLADAADGLLAGERLAGAAALEHGELHLLHGGEPLLAGLAGATAADRAAVLGDPAVEDPGVGVAAVRAVHVGRSLPGLAGGGHTSSSTPRTDSFCPDRPRNRGCLGMKLWVVWGHLVPGCAELTTICGELQPCKY